MNFSWLLASLLLNLASSSVVLAMGFLVLRKHPAPHYRWWVVASAWRVAAAAFGTVLALTPTHPVAGLITSLTMCLNGSGNYLTALRYTGASGGAWVAWWPVGCALFAVPWVFYTGAWPELMLLPPFVVLAGGYWALALALWQGGGSENGVGARFSACFAAIFALHSLAFPFLLSTGEGWGVPLTLASMFLDVALGMGLVVELLEASMAAERKAAWTVRDVGARLSATATALNESRVVAEVAASSAREQEALVRQIVHDLRNATQAMGLIAEDLEAEAQGRPREMALVAALDRQLLFVSTFLRQKLAWIADRGGEGALPTEMGPVLESIQARFAPLLAAKSQSLKVHAPSERTPPLRLESVALEQVLANLVLNAHQHGKVGGHVDLSVAISEGWATFAVHDDGPGVPPEVQAHLGQAADRPDGTGVGLGIVQEVVTRAGGRWGLVSEGGGGSTFHVALPLVTWGAVRGEAPPPTPALGAS